MSSSASSGYHEEFQGGHGRYTAWYVWISTTRHSVLCELAVTYQSLLIEKCLSI